MNDLGTIHIFGECAYYTNEQEEIEAKNYLEYWKNNLLKKLSRDTFEVVLIEQQFVKRDPSIRGCLSIQTQIALKITCKIKFKFEVDQYLGSA